MAALSVDVDATWVNNASTSYDAGELRRADAAMFATPGIVRTGASSLDVSVDGSDTVTVQPGPVVISGESAVTGTGFYRSALAAAVSGTLAARDATNGRIDLVVFQMYDTDVTPADGAYTARVRIIAGTPSATPAVPALPSKAVELARVTVPVLGGAAASVDASYRTYATAIGGTLMVPTAARLPASAAKFQKAKALDTGAEYEWSGSAWLGGGWHTVGGGGEPAFQNSWAVSGGVTVQFRRDGAGNLHMRGLTTGGTSGTVVFTLPTGYRPSANFTVLQTTNTSGFSQVDVATDGTVKVTIKSGTPTVHGLYVPGISLL